MGDDGMIGNQDNKARTSEVPGLEDHLASINVHCDSIEQQICSCVANGKLYRDAEIEILAAVCKGVDITETFSPERLTKFYKKYWLTAGDSFDLRDGATCLMSELKHG